MYASKTCAYRVTTLVNQRVGDRRWDGGGGGPGTRALILFKLLSFSCSFREKNGQIIGWCPHLWFGVLLLGNPGSVTEQHDQTVVLKDHILRRHVAFLLEKW